MTGFTPKEKLTAYQRWEVAAFDEAEQAAARAATAAQKKTALDHDAIEGTDQTPLVLPTASDIERIAFSTIWDACANMQRYVQLSVHHSLRDLWFNRNWNTIQDDFDTLLHPHLKAIETLVCR